MQSCTINNLSGNENINLNAQLFVAKQLAQSGKQDKTITCRHDIHLP
jgi:hypothetical protein